jgi:PhzF family phenazine biosynthesis protein
VDVFSGVPFRGNPVAVVLDGDALSAEQMQRIAAWTHLSETTFILRPVDRRADYRLRIFTPRAELPFAGHPTIGSAHAVLEAGVACPRNGRLLQECGAGLLELSVADGLISLKAPAQRITALDPAHVPSLEMALGAKVRGEPRIVDLGPVWIVAELAGAEAVDALRPDFAALAALSDSAGATGVTVFGETGDADAAIHVRSFAPAHGVPEDPVCGSGNISVAAYLRASGQARRFGASYRARQGMALGRDGRVAIRLDGDNIHLAGRAVTCVEGTLRIE